MQVGQQPSIEEALAHIIGMKKFVVAIKDVVLLESKEKLTGCMMGIFRVPNIVKIHIHAGVTVPYD